MPLVRVSDGVFNARPIKGVVTVFSTKIMQKIHDVTGSCVWHNLTSSNDFTQRLGDFHYKAFADFLQPRTIWNFSNNPAKEHTGS
jgi:hypothetical protein